MSIDWSGIQYTLMSSKEGSRTSYPSGRQYTCKNWLTWIREHRRDNYLLVVQVDKHVVIRRQAVKVCMRTSAASLEVTATNETAINVHVDRRYGADFFEIEIQKGPIDCVQIRARGSFRWCLAMGCRFLSYAQSSWLIFILFFFNFLLSFIILRIT